ncbi:leucine-rich repeat extensin-like protein 1 [Drosophila hydei]|uniref:Leucine-rich repeat extensin-like protein 1 n=1 Tax=Drosophila hydei TaxID=7224 RepID=A0A6J1M8Q1_DROHY|nr:leucine-rich repeat extensin-like protein 1 [Drosophila hydei]
MHPAWLRCFGLLLLVLSCCEAAPSKEKEEQLVRVYPINEEQYESLLKLTEGKNVISEARLTSAGFTAVRNTLGSGWHSLLRIMGFTATRAEQTKIDIDGQPLCVMKRSVDDAEVDQTKPRDLEGKSASDEDSVINCIVVLKRDPALESLSSSNPDFAPYWYTANSAAQPVQPVQPVQLTPQVNSEPQAAELMAKQPAAPETEQLEQQLEPSSAAVTAPQATKKRSKSKKSRQGTRSSLASSAARQYGPPLPPPPPPLPPPPPAPYGSPYGGAYPYGGYTQTPYSQYNPYAPYGQQPPSSTEQAPLSIFK